MTPAYARFTACLPIILESEGGFVNDPLDSGGATNLGITLATYSAWLKRPARVDELRALTPAQAAPLYLTGYWAPCHAGDCPAGVDLIVFDCATNEGISRALRSLQAGAGVKADGEWGPVTEAAVKAAEPRALIEAIAADREAHYRSLPTFAHFGRGWLARLERTKGLALEMAR